MNIARSPFRFAATIALATLLASCGGSGSDSAVLNGPPAPPAPPPAAPCAPQVVADGVVEAGKTASATVLNCATNMYLGDITWTQVGGPPVTLLASHSPTVAFETSGLATGTVRLRADVAFSAGAATTATADIAIAPAPGGSFITVRADHSVRPNSATSVRAWPTLLNGETVTDIAWTQLAGPTVKMDTTDNRLLMFTAPKVAADTALKFRATLTTSSGRQDYDEVTVGLETQAAAPAQGALFDATERVHPYRQTGPYADFLVRCTYLVTLYYQDSGHNFMCGSATVPLLQTEAGPAGIPTVAQVMDRVVVSHDFLGANFEQFLTTQDTHGDFRRLLAGVTAIVIGSHVRPSYYTSGTGAIYLDAGNLWLTPEQRDVVTEVPDYRLAYDDALNYSNAGRMVKNNAYARGSFPATARNTRSSDELIFTLGSLLYHELGHASDFFGPQDRVLNPVTPIWENAYPRVAARSLASDALADQYPLMSAEMKGLGQVLFQGATATALQRTYTGADVGAFFASDRANDDYAYSIYGTSSSREDLAMLFEEFMMSYRHGVQYDIAFTNVYVPGMTNDQLIVGWGERGRIAEPAIKPRIKLVLQRIAPWIDPSVVDSLPAPILMKAGASWQANLVQGTAATQPARPSGANFGGGTRQLRDDINQRRDAHPRFGQ